MKECPICGGTKLSEKYLVCGKCEEELWEVAKQNGVPIRVSKPFLPEVVEKMMAEDLETYSELYIRGFKDAIDRCGKTLEEVVGDVVEFRKSIYKKFMAIIVKAYKEAYEQDEGLPAIFSCSG